MELFDEVPLAGFAYGGSTRVVLNSDSGDFIGAGESYAYTVATSSIVAIVSSGMWYAG